MSVILRSIRNISPYVFPVSQLTLSFLLAVLNWAAINLGVQYITSLTTGGAVQLLTFLTVFVLVPLGLFLWPILLSIVASLVGYGWISPLDINFVTVGIFGVTLWSYGMAQGAIFYALLLIMLGVVLFPVGVAQNALATKFIGTEASEENLMRRIFETKTALSAAIDIALSEEKRTSLGVSESEELDENIVVLSGYEHGTDYYIALSANTRGSGSLLSVVAFKQTQFGITKADKGWFEAKCSAILTALSELNLVFAKQKALPRQVIDLILLPRRGWLHRFREVRGILWKPLLVVVVLGTGDYWFYLTKVITQDTAIFIGFAIALYAVAISIASRRRVFR